MRVWEQAELRGPDGLRLVVQPQVDPGSGEARLDMAAIALNYPDLLMLSGGYQLRPPLPFVPCMEGVGRVAAVGEGVAADLLGKRMLVGGRFGLLAESVTVPLSALRPAPDAFDDCEAAAFTTGALTAWVALVVRGRVRSGERLLVLGAGGGMGLAAVALAAQRGLEVTAVASTAEKLAAAAAAGAGRLVRIDRAAPDLAALAGSMDCVFDPVGGAALLPALRTLAWGGRYLVVGFAGGPPQHLPTDLALLKGIELIGVRAGEQGRQDPAAGLSHRHAIDALAARGQLRPHIGQRIAFAEAPAGFRAMAAGALVGKAVVVTDRDR